MDTGLITTLLGVILAGMFSQTVAVWVSLGDIRKKLVENRASLEKKIDENRCPFGSCPLYQRAKEEAVADRKIRE